MRGSKALLVGLIFTLFSGVHSFARGETSDTTVSSVEPNRLKDRRLFEFDFPLTTELVAVRGSPTHLYLFPINLGINVGKMTCGLQGAIKGFKPGKSRGSVGLFLNYLLADTMSRNSFSLGAFTAYALSPGSNQFRAGPSLGFARITGTPEHPGSVFAQVRPFWAFLENGESELGISVFIGAGISFGLPTPKPKEKGKAATTP